MKTPEYEAFEALETKLLRTPAPATARYVKLVPTGEVHNGIEVVEATEMTDNEAELVQALDDVKKLRAFAQEIYDEWPHVGMLDGFDLQELAQKHGLLSPTKRFKPCADEGCNCAEMCSDVDWREGVECFTKTPLLKGHSK